MQHHLGRRQDAGRLQGQQLRITRAGADEEDRHLITDPTTTRTRHGQHHDRLRTIPDQSNRDSVPRANVAPVMSRSLGASGVFTRCQLPRYLSLPRRDDAAVVGAGCLRRRCRSGSRCAADRCAAVRRTVDGARTGARRWDHRLPPRDAVPPARHPRSRVRQAVRWPVTRSRRPRPLRRRCSMPQPWPSP